MKKLANEIPILILMILIPILIEKLLLLSLKKMNIKIPEKKKYNLFSFTHKKTKNGFDTERKFTIDLF